MSLSITINEQEYIIEQGPNGDWFYRYPVEQKFGKRVKIKDGYIAVWGGNYSSPDPDIGLEALTWGQGSTPAP